MTQQCKPKTEKIGVCFHLELLWLKACNILPLSSTQRWTPPSNVAVLRFFWNSGRRFRKSPVVSVAHSPSPASLKRKNAARWRVYTPTYTHLMECHFWFGNIKNCWSCRPPPVLRLLSRDPPSRCKVFRNHQTSDINYKYIIAGSHRKQYLVTGSKMNFSSFHFFRPKWEKKAFFDDISTVQMWYTELSLSLLEVSGLATSQRLTPVYPIFFRLGETHCNRIRRVPLVRTFDGSSFFGKIFHWWQPCLSTT